MRPLLTILLNPGKNRFRPSVSMFKSFFSRSAAAGVPTGSPTLRILKQAHADRVVFFYPGEEGTYIEHAFVTIYENGIVHIKARLEETTTHLQNIEVQWSIPQEIEPRNIKLLKPKSRGEDVPSTVALRPEPPQPDGPQL